MRAREAPDELLPALGDELHRRGSRRSGLGVRSGAVRATSASASAGGGGSGRLGARAAADDDVLLLLFFVTVAPVLIGSILRRREGELGA